MNCCYGLPDNERLFPIVAEAVQHKLKRECVKSGVKQIRVHDLRHSHVAYLINQGVQPLIIKERLGHRDGNCYVMYFYDGNERRKWYNKKEEFKFSGGEENVCILTIKKYLSTWNCVK